MATKNRSSGDDSSVHQLFQLCSICNQPILAEGSAYKYERDAGIHWACLRKETRQDLVTALLHEYCLEVFILLLTGYPQERRLVLNIFEAWRDNQTIESGLECLRQAFDLAMSCTYANRSLMIEKIGKIKDDMEALAA